MRACGGGRLGHVGLAGTVVVGGVLASIGVVAFFADAMLWGVLLAGAGAFILLKAFRDAGRQP